MFDHLRARINHKRTLKMVFSLDRHLQYDIGLSDSEIPRECHARVLLLSRGPFERSPR